MKTVDLIPLILLELNEKNQYGFELSKSIETKSESKIIIKQPTLYTLLKKLEKSKFITSYWEDSEIGGKRHYYKLTENGKLQIETLPSYDVLLQNALAEDEDNEEILSTPSVTLSESVIPSEEVFKEELIDNSTEFDINSSNIEILRDKPISQEEKFATNDNVSTFTQKIIPVANQVKKEESNTLPNILNTNFSVLKTNDIDIKYVDYVDFKHADSYRTSRAVTRQLIWQSLATCGSILVLAALCYLITYFTGRSPLFYCFFTASLLVALFYPIIVLSNIDKLRLKYQNKDYSKRTKLRIYIGITIILSVFVTCIIVNIILKKNTISLILSVNNFANLYAPLLLSSAYFLDVLYNQLFLSKLSK